MHFLLLFILSCQLWCPTICPAKKCLSCGLANGRSETDTTKAKVARKLKDGRRVYIFPIAPIQANIKGYAPTTTTTGPYWNLTKERCDYLRIRCSRSSTTGSVCGRTMYYQYYTFKNYCALEFHNCLIRYDNRYWMIAYMGHCSDIVIDPDLYVYMTYEQMTNNSKLRQMYIADSDDITDVGYASLASTLSTSTGSTTPFDFAFMRSTTTTPPINGTNGTNINGTSINGTDPNATIITTKVTQALVTVDDGDAERKGKKRLRLRRTRTRISRKG